MTYLPKIKIRSPHLLPRGFHYQDHMVIGFTTTCAISAYHHYSCECEPHSWRCALNTLCDEVCQWLATGQFFSLGTSVSSINKTDSHDITELFLKVALTPYKSKLNFLLPPFSVAVKCVCEEAKQKKRRSRCGDIILIRFIFYLHANLLIANRCSPI